MVNDKGHLYIISNLNSSPLEVRRIATSKELTIKSDWFSMQFMALPDEEAIVLAWADSSKAMGSVKKIPVKYSVSHPLSSSLFFSSIEMSLNYLRCRRHSIFP